MWLSRAHSVGHARQHLNLIGYALMVNSLALLGTGNEQRRSPPNEARYPEPIGSYKRARIQAPARPTHPAGSYPGLSDVELGAVMYELPGQRGCLPGFLHAPPS
jgi:hypothetical protein